MGKSRIFALIALLVISSHSTADTITQWTFETSKPASVGPHAAEVGTGQARVTTTGINADMVGNGSPAAFSATRWPIALAYFEFTTSTTGFKEIVVSWEQSRNASAPKIFDLLYSTDGTNFSIALDDYQVAARGSSPALTWNATDYRTGFKHTVDLSAITALNDAPNVIFRLMSQEPAGTFTSGEQRVDDFTVSGTPLATAPLPGALWGGGAVLLLCGLLVQVRRMAPAAHWPQSLNRAIPTSPGGTLSPDPARCAAGSSCRAREP